MSIIQETSPADLHKQLENQKNKVSHLKRDMDEFYNENNDLKKHRLVLSIISGILALLLLTGLISYFFYPKTFLNISELEKNGVKIIAVEDFNELEESLQQKQQELLQLQESITNLTQDNSDLEKVEEESINNTVIYTVQIGAFENNNTQLYSDNLIQFKEVYKDEFYKYSIGAYSTLEEAQSFRKKIVEIGFRDAFIASYQNGERLKIEEAY